jgi:type VI secretion system protein ImpK
MTEYASEIVYPILRYGLRLKERLRDGERPDLAAEQNELRRLFVPDPDPCLAPGPEDEIFLGFRYPLACWLDEVILRAPESVCGGEWQRISMEVFFVAEPQRAWRFWRQCELAELLGDIDALEVFYLCVMLGFRGERHDPKWLQRWRETVAGLLAQGQATGWPDRPAELPARETHLPPLQCRECLRRLCAACAALAGLAFFLGAYAVLSRWP